MRIARGAPWGALFFCAALTPPAATADVYRWTDSEGTVHYGDRPPEEARKVPVRGPETDEPAKGELRLVAEVPDGDTIHLSDGTEVRLIGLNAPEVAHRDDPAEPGGPEAARFLQRMLGGERVRLTPGEQRRDDYDRLLAHVTTAGGTDVNKRLLRAGHAFAVPHPPNTSRARAYFRAERAARRADRGLWRHEYYSIHPAAEAGDMRNTFRRLRGQVTGSDPARKYHYLEFASGLRAYFNREQEETFARAGRPPGALVGRTVVIRGWVHQRDGEPIIHLRHPAQIEAVE